MLAALQQAWLGRGLCAPNPAVGAVLVQKNQIIRRDWHKGAGTAHAEQLVLQNLPAERDDMILYVTLEPCNHWGKTPPCVLAIIESGIKRVVFGFRDPNPVVAANDTPRLLAAQGIDVIHFPLPEIERFYQSYQYWTRSKMPWITAKIAQSLDGKIAAPGGKPVTLSNDLCAEFTHTQRRHSDLVLTTVRTIIQDDPSLNARCADGVFSKAIAVLDHRLSLPGDARIFTTANTIHIFHESGRLVENPLPGCHYHAIPVIDGLLDLLAAVKVLGQLGYHDVWLEAGGRVFSAMHEQGLVQRTYLYLVPDILGPDAIPAWHERDFFKRQHTITWQAQADNMIACVDWQERTCSPD